MTPTPAKRERCPDCGLQKLIYVGDPLAPRGNWHCANCDYAVAGKNPEPVITSPPPKPAPVPALRPKPVYIPPPPRPAWDRKPIRIQAIVDAVCARMGIEHAELRAPSAYQTYEGEHPGIQRHPVHTLSRELIVVLAKELTKMSYPEIAPWLGMASTRPEGWKCNHSTALTAERRFKARKDYTVAERIKDNNAERLGLTGLYCDELKDQLRSAICGDPNKRTEPEPESGQASPVLRVREDDPGFGSVLAPAPDSEGVLLPEVPPGGG